MRQRLGPKKVAQLAKQTGLPVAFADVRGDTDHMIRLHTSDLRLFYLYPDGELVQETSSSFAINRKGEP